MPLDRRAFIAAMGAASVGPAAFGALNLLPPTYTTIEGTSTVTQEQGEKMAQSLVILMRGFTGREFGFESCHGESMRPTWPARALLVYEAVEFSALRLGDVAIFQPYPGRPIKWGHRLVWKSGAGYQTRGDNCRTRDPVLLTNDNFVGRVVCPIWLRQQPVSSG